MGDAADEEEDEEDDEVEEGDHQGGDVGQEEDGNVERHQGEVERRQHQPRSHVTVGVGDVTVFVAVVRGCATKPKWSLRRRGEIRF